MNFLIAVYCGWLSLSRLRKLVLLFPILCLFTPKGLGLIDVPALPYLSVNRAIVLIMLAVYALHLVASGLRLREARFPWARPFALLAAAYLASLLANPAGGVANALTAAMELLEVFLPCYLVFRFCDGAATAERVLGGFYLAAVAVSLYGTVAYVLHANPYFDYLQHTTPTGRVMAKDYSDSVRGLRAVGTLSHPITYGAFQVYAFVAGVFLMRERRTAARMAVFLALQLLLFVGIVLTNSRTPLVFLLLAMGVFACLATGRDRLLLAQVVAVALALLCVAGLDYVEHFADFVASVFSSDAAASQNGSSMQMRLGQLLVAWGFFVQSPLFGGGIAMTRSIVASGRYPDFYNAESALFQWLIDLGLLGTVAYAWLFASVYAAARRRVAERSRYAAIHGLVTGYLVFVLATGVLETLQLFLVVVALMLIAGQTRAPLAPGAAASGSSLHSSGRMPPPIRRRAAAWRQ